MSVYICDTLKYIYVVVTGFIHSKTVHSYPQIYFSIDHQLLSVLKGLFSTSVTHVKLSLFMGREYVSPNWISNLKHLSL